jgi:hypothetical protein
VTIPEQRNAVTQEALTWEFCPFSWHSSIKGEKGGVDCGMLLKACYAQVGIIADVPAYSTQFFLNRSVELYLEEIEKHCILIDTPEHGDLIAYKMGRAFGHAVIVLDWPICIHADGIAKNVHKTNAETDPDLCWREKKIYSPKQWHGII